MSNENWTKGEWLIEYDNCDYGHGQWCKVGPAKLEANYKISVEEELEWKANVHLIAAAPKLYSALKRMHEIFEKQNQMLLMIGTPQLVEMDEIATKALAEARGEDT